jgi:hypothetical protein
MRITVQTIGSFVFSEFDMTPVIANEYIPLSSINNMVEKEGFLCYFKPSIDKFITKPNTLKNIRDAFEMAWSTRRIEINGKRFFIAKGVFFSEAGVPLMVCAMKKEAFLNESVSRFSDFRSDTFSYNNYVLFYSTSFFTDPSLTPLNRRLQKEILQTCYEKGIEVRTITSLEIEKNTFARLFEVKKTKSLTQLEAYMEQVLPNFLHNEGEDTFVEKEFEPIVLAHEEELSVEEEAMLFDNSSTPVIQNLYTTHNVTGSIAELSAEARELAELEAEAAQFDIPSESLESSDDEFDDDENYGEDFYWGDEQDEDEEEMQRHEEAAHTGSERNVTMYMSQVAAEQFQEALRAEAAFQLSMPHPHPAGSIVERMREAVRYETNRQSMIELVDDTE